MAAFYRQALEWPELEIETSEWCWRELPTCYMTVMPRMSFSWMIHLVHPVGGGSRQSVQRCNRCDTFWLALVKEGRCVPSRLMVAATSLA
jgi:hypothetical protein